MALMCFSCLCLSAATLAVLIAMRRKGVDARSLSRRGVCMGRKWDGAASKVAERVLEDAAALGSPGDGSALVADNRRKLRAMRDWASDADFSAPGFREEVVSAIDGAIDDLDRAIAGRREGADGMRRRAGQEPRWERRCDMEEKARFVELLNAALVECGDGRYDHLADQPMVYERSGGEEFVTRGIRRACVTGDSLVGVLQDIVDQGVL